MLNSALSSKELTEYKVYKVISSITYRILSLRHEISLTFLRIETTYRKLSYLAMILWISCQFSV